MAPKRPARPTVPRRRATPGAHICQEDSTGVTEPREKRKSSAPTPPGPASTERHTESAGERPPRQKSLPATRTTTPRSTPPEAPAPASSGAPGSSRVIDARDRFLSAVKPPPWQRSRKPIVITLAAIIALAAITLAVLAYVPTFAVSRLSASGTSYVAQEDVVAAASQAKGEPLAFVDAGKIEQDIASVPGVESARVTRHWPDALSVDVTERVAAGRLTRDGKTTVVDASGVALPSEAAGKKRLPVVNVPAHARNKDGVQASLLEVLGALPADLRTRVTEVTGTVPTSVTLKMDVNGHAKTVVWGGPEDSALKAQVLEALAGQPGTVIDLTSPHAPTVR